MLMVIGCLVVLVGVVIGWYTVAGSGISAATLRARRRPGARAGWTANRRWIRPGR